jgi:betaine-aldehyde dehydrogenase
MKALNLIDGEWTSGRAGSGHCIDPATGEPVAEYADAGAGDGAAAIAAAAHAFEHSSWARKPRLRAEVLHAFADNVARRAPQIEAWLVSTSGKLAREAKGELAASVSELRYYAGLARNLWGRVAEIDAGCYSQLVREPIGVAAIIVPWNAPATLLVRSLAPALAAGCTVVVKAAHQTSAVNHLMLECLTEVAALPKGVVNSMTESGSAIARLLCESPQVDAISFTGSSATGKKIAAAAAGTLKRLSLELGGKAPAIVLEDCDLDAAAPGLAAGAMALSGQMCTAIARILVHESRFEAATTRLAALLGALRMGPGSDPRSQLAPLIDADNRDRVVALAQAAAAEGAVHLRGTVPGGALARGAFVSPTVVEIADLESRFVQQELFGPILLVERFATEREAVERANATRYGLAASVWTQDHARALAIARELKSGTVWINTHNRLFAEAETGGYRESGYGRLHGVEGLNDFLETKHVYYETGKAP